MKKLLMAVLLVAAAQVHAQFNIYGIGKESCGMWLELKEERLRSGESYGWLVATSWVQGYMSMAGDAGIKMKKTDMDAVSAFIDNHCREKPLDQLLDATRALVLELAK